MSWKNKTLFYQDYSKIELDNIQGIFTIISGFSNQLIDSSKLYDYHFSFNFHVGYNQHLNSFIRKREQK